ncbi:hypothetical protein SKAU_G00129920 [Synaphobranchus kaupii]|uniref:Telomere length regulation protein TEL2 homolog n=1 Tax=Synaphobranchus kaupii TaxID=118154 RepID=A0A9Q1J2X1_SYNKA|nr:hypothetical protein SKAU_G00129920 [Synaphobranchus kaupii]
MEQILLSSPGVHADWELDQKPSLGFLVLDPDKVSTLPKGGKENLEPRLDFRETGKEVVPLSLDEILQENALNLDNLFRNSRYSSVDKIMSWNERSECPVLQWENHSFPPLQFTQSEPADVPNFQISSNEQIDFRVSPSVQIVAGSLTADTDNSSFREQDLQNKAPMELMKLHSSPGEHLSLNDAPPPVQVFARNEESSKTDFSPLEQLLCAEPASSSSSSSSFSCVPLPNGASPQGVSEEPSLLSRHEESSLNQSQGVETLSCETEDKGLFLEPVRDPLTVSNAIPEGSSESHLSSPSHTCGSTDYSQTLDVQEGSELVQCGAGAHLNGGRSVEDHALHTSEEGCLSSRADDTEQNVPVDTPTLSASLEQCCEGDSSLPGLRRQLTEPKAATSCPDGDAAHQGGLLSRQGSDGGISLDLMEEHLFPGSTQQGRHVELTGNSRPTADAMHGKEAPYPNPPESTLQESLPGLELNGRSGEAEAEFDLDEVYRRRDCPEDLAQELDDLSSGNLWTTKEAVEGLSLSEVGASNSLPMGGSVSEGDEDLSSLKAVFNALDQDGDGFVRIEEFMQFATAYGAEQVKDLTRFLDPSGLGVISFEDFYRGIAAISNGGSEPQLCDVGFNLGDEAGVPEEYDDYVTFEQNEVTDSAYLGSESTYSECETFTDEDTGAPVHPELHEEVETDSAIDAALHDPEETGSRLSLGSELNSHSLTTVIGGEEEHFEDFGENHTLDLLLESPGGPVGEGSPAHCSSLLLSPSSSKRLSSKKVARHLLQSSTLTIDSMDDLSRDILDLADTDITDKVMFLEKRVSELEKDTAASGEQHARLRQENLQLVHRANALEEQLKEQEARAEEALHLEVRRHKEALCKLERERGMELENLQSRLQQLDEENSELRSCVPCLRANIERLEEEKRKLQDNVEDMTERLNEELESHRKMTDKLTHERHKNQTEKECTQELIEDLRKQLEHLQLYKLEVEAKRGRSSSAGLQEYQNRTREAELEQEIRRLKQDNRSLKEQNDELNGQIINLSIQGAKNLFATSFSDSLAAEISSVSRDELMEAIHKQEEINFRLQDYIDRIIVAIMESSPSILEQRNVNVNVLECVIILKIACKWRIRAKKERLRILSSAQCSQLWDGMFLRGPPDQALLVLMDYIGSSSPNAGLDKVVDLLERYLQSGRLAALLWSRCQGIFSPDSPQLKETLLGRLVCLPDLTANRLHPRNRPLFLPDQYYPLLARELSITLERTCQALRDNQDCSLRFVAQLLGKACMQGHSEHMFKELAPRLSTHTRSDMVWQRVCWRLMEDVPERWMESVVTGLVQAVEGPWTLSRIMGNIAVKNKKAQFVITHKLLLLQYKYETRVVRSLVGYLAQDRDRRPLLVQVLRSLCQTWANSSAVRHTPVEQQLYLSRALLLCLGLLSDSELQGLRPELLQCMLGGMQCHLDNSVMRVRRAGMIVGECLSARMDANGPQLKFQYEEDEETRELLSMMDPLPAEDTVPEDRPNSLQNDQSSEIKGQSSPEVVAPQTSSVGQDCESELDSDDELTPYDMSEDKEMTKAAPPLYLRECLEALLTSEDPERVELSLRAAAGLVRKNISTAREVSVQLTKVLLHLENKYNTSGFLSQRQAAMIALTVMDCIPVTEFLTTEFYSLNYSLRQRLDILEVLALSAQELSEPITEKNLLTQGNQPATTVMPFDPSDSPLHWQQVVERRIQSKTRRFAKGVVQPPASACPNRYAPVAGFFFFPLLRNYDRPQVTFDLLGSDHLVLGRLIHTLGLLVHLAVNAPVATQMGRSLLDFVWAVRYHADQMVRRGVLFAICSVFLSMPNQNLLSELSDHLLETRAWLADVAEEDPDTDCRSLAMQCLVLLEKSLKTGLEHPATALQP